MDGGMSQLSAPSRATGSVRAVRWLTVLGLSVAIGMVALGTGVLWDSRQDTWHQALRLSDNLTMSMGREIARTISVYDLSLQGAVDALSQPGIADVSKPLRHAAIFDRAAAADYLASILVLDANGDIVDDSRAIEPRHMNFADRDYFTAQRDNPNLGLFVSRPFASRLRDGDPSIAISRRLIDSSGHFAGVVVGTLKLSYFKDMFSRLQLPNGAIVLLERTDGHMVVRLPALSNDLDRPVPGSPILQAFQHQRVGAFQAHSIIDGTDLWMTYRQIGTLPLVVAISIPIDTIFSAWWPKALGIGAIMLVLSGTTVALILMFRHEMLRRMRAEESLFNVASRLSVIAATDGLTGLANRRSFEADLLHEWKRAVRGKTHLALLILDADWFKSFNDSYGHVEGDEVLRRIAVCIELCIRRPGDVAARYGGEEFVALLPETEIPGATLIAERICAAVAALEIPHANSPLGHVTVSIGVAVAHPCQGGSQIDLVRTADRALYNAKRAGRACVSIGPALSDQGTAANLSAVNLATP